MNGVAHETQMYNFDHFHSTSHEVLGIASGKARLCFGHEENPQRVVEVLEKGKQT
jgi:uncharacterized protein YjlB